MYSAMILGCGLGKAATTKEFVAAILEQPKLPRLLIDADGLNSLAALENWPDRLPPETLLTPHPAEMGRLCGLSVAQVTEARWSLARKMAAEWNVVILLKGPYTVIAAPDGRLAVLPVATAALATAGTGDVLSGIVGGLMAQGLPPFSAACLGSWLHGQAGLRCAADIGTTGVLASDLLVILPHIITDLREHGRSIPIVAGRP
jgi:NAD(P)H-hydrate epimerase